MSDWWGWISNGGSGGGYIGGSTNVNYNNINATGGTQTSGGLGGGNQEEHNRENEWLAGKFGLGAGRLAYYDANKSVSGAGGGGYYGGGASWGGSGAGGSGYIGNSRLYNKHMAGYDVPTSTEESTYTITTTNVSETATADYAKQGNGYARITLISAKESSKVCTVTFNSNGGTGTMQNQEIPYNVETNLNQNTFTKTGYIFNGWNTKADGTGKNYTNMESVQISKDITLYAQWAKYYTVSYNANGGSGNIASYKTYNYGEEFTVPNNGFIAPANKEFLGWKDENKNYYHPGEKITLNDSIELSALWVYSGSILNTAGSFTRFTGIDSNGEQIDREFIKLNDGFSIVAIIYYDLGDYVAASPWLIGFNSTSVDNSLKDQSWEAHINSPSEDFSLYSKTWRACACAGFTLSEAVNFTNISHSYGSYTDPFATYNNEDSEAFIERVARLVLEDIFK